MSVDSELGRRRRHESPFEPIQLKRLTWTKRPAFPGRRIFTAFSDVKSRFDERFPSWRGGMIWFSILAILILVLNFATLIWAALNRDDTSFSTVSTMSCEKAKSSSWWLSLLVNFLGSALLASSNYCMQYLSAPTRDEVNKAHAAHSFLDIGILSFRNIRSFSKTRMTLWLLLAASSAPLHLV